MKSNPSQLNICELVRKAESDFVNGTTKLSKYVDFLMSENINKIEAYLNSKHISGEVDSQGREKPFFNIVTAATNIWYRATDLDRKNIIIKATKSSDIVGAFIATVLLQNWMKKDKFGMFLNEWGRTLSKYGSAIVKAVEVEGIMHCMVMPWIRMIVDTVDFDSNPRIEILELTPAQLREHPSYNQEIVENLLMALSTRKTSDGQAKDNKSEYIKLYEVHGNLSLAYLTGNERDENTYQQQMHIISFVNSKNKGKYDDFCLFSGKENKDPYIITHLIKEDGRTMAIGAVENLFEAQWMVNHTTKAIKDQLDLASQLIFQTSDGNFAGQNVLTSIQNGDILIHAINQPLTQIQNNSHDITSLQNYGNQWKILAQEITSTPDIMMGNNMPSGTAYRQAAIIQQESHSNFEMMTENKALYLEDLLREYIIPYLKKKMDTADEISAILDDAGISKIDTIYVKNEAIKRHNQKVVEQVLKQQEVTGLDINQEQNKIKEDLKILGNQRFFIPSEVSDKKLKDVFKDLEWEVSVEIVSESIDKQTTMDTLSNVLQTLAKNPMILQDPSAKMLFNKILNETSVVSPLELPAVTQPNIPQQVSQPAMK